jgi:small GTP-binding protein
MPLKVVLVGDSGVGKTSILLRLNANIFRSDSAATVGSGCSTRPFMTTSGDISLQIWDTAGEEQYRSLTRLYVQNAVAALIVFDVSSESTFASIPSWIDTVRETSGTEPVIFLVGNKVDLAARAVEMETGGQFAREHGLSYFDVSAKTGFQVDLLFADVAERVARRQATAAPSPSPAPPGQCC